MPYKDKEKRKELSREAMRKRRGVNIQGLTKEALTEQGLTEYHPILYALVDPVKRKKLQDICGALSHRNLQSNLFYGCGIRSLPFDVVEQLLEATS